MADVSNRSRQPKGQAIAGEFATERKGESSVELASPEQAQALMVRNRWANFFEKRAQQMERFGYAQATSITSNLDNRSTSKLDQWWANQMSVGEYQRSGGHLKMPDDYTPSMKKGRALSGHRRTYRKRYGGANMELRMPSVTAIKRFSAGNKRRSFDVPMSVTQGHKSGFAVHTSVRVTEFGPNEWKVESIAGNLSEAQALHLEESVQALLESRRPEFALREMTEAAAREKRLARVRAEGVERQQIDSTFVTSAAYDENTGTLAVTMGQNRRRIYAYGGLGKGALAGLVSSPSPGKFYNDVIKGHASAVKVEECRKCGRTYFGDVQHRCAGQSTSPLDRQDVFSRLSAQQGALNLEKKAGQLRT